MSPLILYCLLLCWLTSCTAKQAAVDSDESRIQGTWKAQSGYGGARQLPPDWFQYAPTTIHFAGNMMFTSETPANGPATKTTATFALNSSCTPRRMTVNINSEPNRGTQYQSIYDLTGNTLKIAVTLNSNALPTGFEQNKKVSVIVFVRQHQ